MRKSIIVCCALLLTCSSAAVLSACNEETKEEAQKMFATYETWQDGFYNINMMDGFGRISRSDEQAHGGSYSAKLQPLGSHTDSASPYFYYPMQMEGTSGYNYTDFSKLENVTFWMYNAEEEEVSFDFCIVASVADVYGTDYKSVKSCTLAPGQWTQIIYTPDYNALQDMCDITNVAGIAFLFENRNSADIADAPVLYLDDLSIAVSDSPLAEIKTSTPERGEIQSFDLASSMVYVRLQSGLDYAESYLAAGSDKLPEGVKGGVEFTVTDAEMGSWPRLHFDSRTPQSELAGADRFSLMLYFGTSDPTVTEAELHMFPDTSSEYVEYVATNEWVKVVIDSETMLNNFGDSIGVRSMGLFWLQNGGTSCFNAIDVVRVADIRAEFDEVRVPELSAGSAGTEYTLAEASLEIDGTPVTAESWSYSVSYKNAALCGDGYPEITLTDRTFTPATGGTYVATYTAQYQGKTYTASAEFDVARPAAAEGELESFDDPAVLDTIRMNSGTGTEYTSPEYLWAGDTRLDGASDGTKGGVEYTIPAVDGGTWPRFYFTSRATTSQIAQYDTVAFDIYLDAPDHDDPILIKMYPETEESDQYVMPNTWVTVILDGAQCADLISRVSPESVGFFWVQNGARETGAVNIIKHIRIANIRAFNVEEERGEPETTEIEAFDDVYSLGNLTIANASLEWDETEQAAVGSLDPTADLWMDVSVKARRSLEDYEALKEQGYNAVTLELYLEAADGSTARNAQMQYWAGQNDLSPSQASVAIGEWVTLTFDLDTYLTALEKSANGFVTFFWVASYTRTQEYDNGQTRLEFPAHLAQVRIRNVQVAKVIDAVSFGQGAEDFFLLDAAADVAEQTYYASDSSEIPAGRPQAVQNNGAVKLSLTAGTADRWPHLKFSADRNMFSDGNTVVLTLYVASGGGAGETLSIRQWPHGSDWVVNGELPVGEWVEFAIDAEVLRSVYNWAPWGGIEYTDLFWFTNPSNTPVEIWIAGMRVEQREAVDFSETGIVVEPTQVSVMESGESGFSAWVGITSTKGYAYKLTVKKGDTVLVKGTDYTVNNDDASVTLINPEAGDYTFSFESYGNRFTAGSVTVTVAAKEYTVEIGAAQMGVIGTKYSLPAAQIMSDGNACDNVTWSYELKFGDGEYKKLDEASFTPDAEGDYTVRYTATYRTRQYTKELVIKVGSYEVVADQPEGTTPGSSVTLPAGTLQCGDVTVSDGIEWTYTVTFADSALYESLFGAIEVKDMAFTPMMAGEYTIVYQAVYGGKTYTAEKTVTINRAAAAADEIESFDDASALERITISDVTGTTWNATEKAVVGTADADKDSWLNVSVKARRSLEDYQTLKTEGYNAVTFEIFLKAAEGNSSDVAQMKYWPDESELSTQTSVAVGEWVTLTFDLDTYLTALGNSGDKTVKFFWVASTGDTKLAELHIRGGKAVKTENAVSFTQGAEGFFFVDGADVTDSSFVSDALPEGADGAVKIAFGSGYPNVKFGADKNMFTDAEAVTLTFKIESTSSDPFTLILWPDDAAHRAKGFTVTPNEWTTLTVDAQALRDVFGSSRNAANDTFYTNLFWFSNPDGKATAILIAGLCVGEDAAAPVAFSEAGISAAENVSMYEAGETDLQADVTVTSTKGYAYKLTVLKDGTELEAGSYSINNDAIVTLYNPEAGDYTFSFESYGGRFTTGSITVTVAAKEYTVEIGAAQMGVIGTQYSLPAAQLMSDGNACDNVAWSYELKFGDGEYSALDGASFTPDAEGDYTVRYTATYRGRTYTDETTIKVGSYEVVADQPEGTTSGNSVTLPAGTLQCGDVTVSDGIEWTYTVTFADSALYESLFGAIEVKDMAFTPMMAGEYTIVYQAVYGGKTYTAEKTVTINRAAAAADEVESFDDASALSSVRLESGSDYQKTYLLAGSELLPEGAKGGVSFAVTDGNGGNWPNLHFDSRMGEAIRSYDAVEMLLYLGVKDQAETPQIQLELFGKRAVVATNTWIRLCVDAQAFADANISVDGNSILWVQNGGDGVVNQLNEFRIAGITAVNTLSAFDTIVFDAMAPSGNSWVDGELAKDEAYFNTYYDVSVAPAGMPLESNRVLRMYFKESTDGAKDGSFECWPQVTGDMVQGWIDAGYTSIDVAFYFAVAEGDSTSETVLLQTYPSNGNLRTDISVPVGKWQVISFGLEGFRDVLWQNGDNWQIKWFYLNAGMLNVTDIWISGFTVGKAETIEIVNLDDESAVGFFNFNASGESPNVEQISWESAEKLAESNIVLGEGKKGAVKFVFQSGKAGRIDISSKTIDKQLYRSYEAKILIYIESDKESVNLRTIHNGFVDACSVKTGEWVTITLPAYDDGAAENNCLYDVCGWFDGYTGLLNFEADSVTAVYVAGVWLESPAAAE